MAGTEIRVFELDRRLVFKHYFEEDDLFDELREHYVPERYRFEVPTRAWEAVATTLREHGHEPVVVDDPEAHCVVIGQYEPHAEILRDAVATWTRHEHRFFLLPSPLAVEQAIERGATPVADSEFEAGI